MSHKLTYHRLSLAEREEISRGLASGRSLNQIARELLRSKSTLSREINRSRKLNHYTYRAFHAHRRAWRAPDEEMVTNTSSLKIQDYGV